MLADFLMCSLLRRLVLLRPRQRKPFVQLELVQALLQVQEQRSGPDLQVPAISSAAMVELQ